MQTWIISGPCSVIRGAPSSITRHPAQAHLHWAMPLANAQRPLTRAPPSTRVAAPAGAAMPAVGSVGSPKTSRAPSSGM